MPEEQKQSEYDRRNRTYQDLIQQKDETIQGKGDKEYKGNNGNNGNGEGKEVISPKIQQQSLLSRIGSTTKRFFQNGVQTITGTKVQELQTQDQAPKVQNQAEAAGYLKILEGIGEQAGQAAQLSQMQQLQQQAGQAQEKIQAVEGMQQAQSAASQAQQAAQAQQQRQEQLRQVQEKRRREQQEAQQKLKVSKPQPGLLKSLISSEVKPNTTSKVLNAGMPGLGLVYKLFQKIVP